MVSRRYSNCRVITFAKLLDLVLVLFLSAPVYAQIVGATISGTVVDTSHAVIAGASISLKNVATGIVTNAVTNGGGFYTVPNLQANEYELTASGSGFSTELRRGIILTVGQELVLNVTLQVGTSTQKVQVTGEVPTVSLANSTLGGVANTTTIEDLPLNGRSWTDLADLQPGVIDAHDQPPVGSGDRTKRGFGNQLIIGGGRPQANNYLLDGVNINDYSNGGPGSVLGGNLGADAVAEFSVLTTNYSTEYGRTSGGVISAITKSGTNRFHGSAYEYFRNSALDARNFFDPAIIPAFRRNQYGASAGGPIQKDKTFIFGDYEGIKQDLGTTTISNVPTAAARAGDLVAGPVTVDPAVAQFIKAFIPLPNVPNSVTGDAGLFEFPSTNITTENFFIIRADHTFSEKDRISTTFMFDRSDTGQDDEYGNKIIHNPVRRYMIALEENHIFTPQLLNSFRAGFNRDNVESPSGATAINPATTDRTGLYSFIPGETAGAIDTTIPELNNGFSGGVDAIDKVVFHFNSWQAYDNLFYTKGIHSMKFGANFERIEDNSAGLNYAGGLISFNSLSDFLTNLPASIYADAPGKRNTRGLRQSIVGAYFQDDAHLRPNLTVNVGMRYEMATIITEVHNELANLRVLSSAFPQPFLGSPYFQNPTKLNFEPRVGFAWDPFKNGKTAVRGGFGIFDMLPLPVEMGPGVDNSYPFSDTVSSASLPAGSFPSGAWNFVEASAQNSHNYYITPFTPKRDYVMQWNFNIQRELTPSTTAMVGYVGGHGQHMRVSHDNADMVMPTLNAQGQYEWPCPAFVPTLTPQGSTINLCSDPGTGTLVNQFSAKIPISTYNGAYFYDALQIQIKKTMSRGLQVEGSYTWSKDIDNGSSSAASDQFRNSIDNMLWFCPRCYRSLADADMRHRVTVNYVWNIPTRASFGAPAKAILGGWQAGGILTLESGTPFTALVAGDPLGQVTKPHRQFPNRIVGPGCTTDVNPGNPNHYIKFQCFSAPNPSTQLGNGGRNDMIGPGLESLDFSLSKSVPLTKVSENFKAQLRGDFFNILNRSNFSSPVDNNAIMNSDGSEVPFEGQVDSTKTTSRQIQISLRLTW
jgi:hypothetical protein